MQLGPSLVHLGHFSRWSAIFNKLVVCPTSSPDPGFNRWGLLWCFWGVTHPLRVWLRSEPGHCVVETQRSLHCLFWKSRFLALGEGQCWGEPLNEKDCLGDMFLIWTYFGHAFWWKSGGESGLSRFGLARCSMMDLTYFYVTRIPMLILLLYIVHHDRKNCCGASLRHFNGVLVEMETDPSVPPPPRCSFFLSILTLSQALPQQEEPNYRDIGPMLKTW